MRVFEFYFNPKAQKNIFLKVFSVEPEKPKDKRKGNLYIVGQLSNALEANSSLLTRLAGRIQEEYYATQLPPEKNLKAALRGANAFLAQEVKNGNVDWIGNLHIAVLLIVSQDGQDAFYFTKSGSVKVWMTRKNTLADLGKNIEEKQSHTAKVFGNVASGNLLGDDKIIVLTPELYDLCAKHNLIQDIAFLKDKRQFQELFKAQQKELSRISGILFTVLVEAPQDDTAADKPVLMKLPNVQLPVMRFPRTQIIQRAQDLLRIPRVKMPTKTILLPVLLIAILAGGYMLFQDERNAAAQEAQIALEVAASLNAQADMALAEKNEKKANSLLQAAFKRIVPFMDIDTPSTEQLAILQEEIAKKLFEINNVKVLDEIKPIFTLPRKDTSLIPTKLLLVDEAIYFYNPFSSELLLYNMRGDTSQQFQVSRNIKHAAFVAHQVVLYVEPNTLLTLKENGSWSQETTLAQEFTEQAPEDVRGFSNSMYTLDEQSGEIIQYSNLLTQKGTAPVQWIHKQSQKRAQGAKTFAIDGDIWVLKPTGKLERYFKGLYRETIELDIFPALTSPIKLATHEDARYLFLLDTEYQRIIVTTKFGEVVAQYQSPAFDNMLDFGVSKDGSLIYVLSGNNVYRISTEALQ
jgi:hypothetical protein